MHRFTKLALTSAIVLATGATPFQGPRPTLTASDVVVTEGETAYIVLTLSEPVDEYVVLFYETSGRSADAGVDFIQGSGPVFFEPGVTQQIIPVPTLDDLQAEKDEIFTVRLDVKTVRTPGGPIRVTIVDND